VNFVLNRKALASTSATPGHTKQFHLFAVNEKQSRDGYGGMGVYEMEQPPSFRLVDVPGIGYAEAAEGRQVRGGGIHTYIHTYILHTTYIPTYLHTHIHTYLHTYIHTYLHTNIHNTYYILNRTPGAACCSATSQGRCHVSQ
jgi:GTP-binding protein EngB required for normal cell division